MEEKFKDLLRAVERSEDGVTQNVANMIDVMQKYLENLEELTQPFYTMPAEQMNALITWGFVPGAKVRYDGDDIDLVFEGYTEMMRLKFRKPDGTETIASIESMAKNLKHFTLLAMGGTNKTEPKFTPGPWKFVRVQPGIDTFAIRTTNDDTLAAVGVSPVGWRKGKDIANAALIAAAPEMYALLERLEQLGEKAKIYPMLALEKKLLDIIEEARRILAKARGEAETCKG